jgi:hypothetical protein
LNWRVLGVTIALSVLCGGLFGLAPAIQTTRPALVPALKEMSRLPRYRLPQLLVVGQIALLMLLLVGAGLFVRTLSNLQSIPLGFNRDNLLLVELNAPQAGYPEANAAAFYDTLRQRVSEIPVSAASRSRTRRCSRRAAHTRFRSMACWLTGRGSCRPVRDSFRRCRFRSCRAARSTSAIWPAHCRSWS